MINNQPLQGEKILITGVSRLKGIGATLAAHLASAGAQIATHGYPVYDQEMQYADAGSALDPQISDQIHVLPPSDLAVHGEPERAVDSAKIALGGLTGLILNHAYSTQADMGKWTEAHIDRHLQVNVRASMMMLQRFAAVADHGGCVTLFTSGQYLGPMIGEIAYAVSKEAIRCLCAQATPVLAKRNIRINCVNPGPNDTGYLDGEAYADVARLFPAGRWGSPTDAAKLVCFLHSKEAEWITGQTIASEGGFQR